MSITNILLKLSIKFQLNLRSYAVAIQSQSSKRCIVVHIPPINTKKLNHLFLSIYKELSYKTLTTYKHHKNLRYVRVWKVEAT